MDLDKDLTQKVTENDTSTPETEAERVLRESLERGRQRAEQSRMTSPWFVLGMMTLIVVTMIGLMVFVNHRLASKKPTAPNYQKTTKTTPHPTQDDTKIELTKQICLKMTDMCLKYPETWTANLTQNTTSETLELTAKNQKALLTLTLQPYIEPTCDEQTKARIFERKTLAIRQLGLENLPDKTNLWARSLVYYNVAGQAGDKELGAGRYYPVLTLENIAQADRKYAVVGSDQINGCQLAKRQQIKSKDGTVLAVTVAFRDHFFANNQASTDGAAQSSKDAKPTYSPLSSEQKALDFLKTESARTMYEIIASAQSAQIKN